MPESTEAISWEQEGDVTIVRFTTDHIADEDYVHQARQELRELSERVGGKMVVSLANVRFMASVGLGILVEINKVRKRANAQLHVCDMRPSIRWMFSSTKIDRVLGIYDTMEEAIAAFGNLPRPDVD